MSNWFDENNEQEKNGEIGGQPPIVPPVDQAPAPQETAPEAAAPTETPEEPAGWQRSESDGYSYTPPQPQTEEPAPVIPQTPPQEAPIPAAQPQIPQPQAPQMPQMPPQPQMPQAPWGNNPYTPPAQAPRTPPAYTPQAGYNPYGWGQAPQPPQTPPGKPPKKKRNKSNIAIAILAVVGGAAIITLSVLLALTMSDTSLPIGDASSPTSSSVSENPNAPSLDITSKEPDDGGLTAKAIINKNLNCTVVISMYNRVQANNWFGGNSTDLTQVGGASGIIYTSDGYIITNWHCVYDENTGNPFARIDVTTYDGTTYEGAQIVGADEDTDLAVLKINAANLSAAEIGDSSALAIGDRVVTLGNAGGLEWSASQGIISGLARDVYEDTGYAIKCLQTDAAINPGNSGGPLLNDAGQVVGVNSAKIAATGYEGLGFSIPIAEAKPIIDDLAKYGYVRGRVMLGITGTQVDQPGYEGFMIRTIEEGSVLLNTRAQVGDIITHVDGVKIRTYAELRTELSKHNVGDRITLTLLRVEARTGQTVTFDVSCTLGESQG